MKRSRGAVLVVVLGVLVVLALLGTVFCLTQAMERDISRNYVDHVRAKLLAQSGVDHATMELRRDWRSKAMKYWGLDIAENGSAAWNVPLGEARNPSYAIELDEDPTNGNVAPRQLVIDGQPRGISGVTENGTYGLHADVYSVRVTDSSGKIHVNEGVGQLGGNDSTGSRNLRRILNRLGAIPSVGVPGLGDLVVGSRPTAGYRSILDLQKPLGGSFEKVKEFLTAHAWTDRVANPVPLSAAHAAAIAQETGVTYWRGSPAIYRFGRGKDHEGAPVLAPLQAGSDSSLGHAVYAMDELNPQWIEITTRAPVNVNAAPREVLVALLSDLRGVFLSERRRNNIARTIGGYHFMKVKHTYSPANMPVPPELPYGYFNVPEGDEVGFLYETYPIVGPGATSSGISAFAVAEHLLACRESRATQGVTPGFDYSTVWFGKPFRTWRQFHAFCDNLVAIQLLVDPRPIYYDHAPSVTTAGNITGYTAMAPSDFQRAIASQAIADVLKANFNPNLHLNELNPDRNLHLLVDKTDLVVHSTEFLFTSNGYFDVESLGRVLRPAGGDDAWTATDNRIVAESRISAGVKLFELVRDGAQADFAKGTCASASSLTNNQRSLETGPEPDNGPAPVENAWGGYLALPTVGGHGVAKPTGGVALPTPQGTCEQGETIHAHLAWDFQAHYHKDGKRQDLGSADVDPKEKVENFADPGEPVGGPYDPTDGGYRLARSFTLPATGSVPGLTRHAPLDLRVDGGYLERHSGLAYWISPTSYVENTMLKKGAISFWVKPNYRPERSGKPRLWMDMSQRINAWQAWSPQCVLDPWVGYAGFMAIWNPGHEAAPGQVPYGEGQTTWNEVDWYGGAQWGVQPFKPQSLLFGVGYGPSTGHVPRANIGWSLYYQYFATPPLNHEGHDDGRKSQLKAHEWMHVVLSWEKYSGTQSLYQSNVPTSVPVTYKVFINGQLAGPGFMHGVFRPQVGLQYERDYLVDWTVHHNGERNSLRFGSPSRVNSQGSHYTNFSADSTIDEIYFWNSNQHEGTALLQWLDGRYSFPKGSDEGIFTSREISVPCRGRALAPGSIAQPPGVTGTVGTPAAIVSPCVHRVLGISWTWMAEGVDANGSPVLVDAGPDGGTLSPKVRASLPGLALGEFGDDGFTAVDAVVPAGESFRYRLRFEVPGAGLNTVLLATPVVDDVTLYVSCDASDYTYFWAG